MILVEAEEYNLHRAMYEYVSCGGPSSLSIAFEAERAKHPEPQYRYSAMASVADSTIGDAWKP